MSHAKLNASGAHRWIACPGSIQLAETLPPSLVERTSFAASEGTAAHQLAEMCLREEQDAEAHRGELISVKDWPDPFRVDDDMIDAVQIYLDDVRKEEARLKASPLIEAQVQPLPREDMWGTADAILLEPFGELIVYDYKHGRGVVVEPAFNPQCMFYALGALRRVGGAGDVSKVTIKIVQPRAFHPEGSVRAWETTPAELEAFGETLQNAAEVTQTKNPPLVTGDHCRWCPGHGACPEAREAVKREVQLAFDSEPELPAEAKPILPDPHDPAQVSRAMLVIPMIDEWARAVEGMAHRILEAGDRIPGFKLVRKRANRRWENVGTTEARLKRMKGVSTTEIFKPRELKSPAQIEKIKKIGKDWVAKNAVKPEGGLTIAREADAREEVVIPRQIDALDDLPRQLAPLKIRQPTEEVAKDVAGEPSPAPELPDWLR